MGKDMNYSKYMDHTVLKVTTTKDIVTRFCNEAKEYGFASVCVNPYWISYVAEQLKGTDVKACAVIGFPLGANKTEIKALEAKLAVQDGAQEVDMVINVGALKDGEYDYVKNEIAAVVEAAHPQALVKVIIESSDLTDEEKIKACELSVEAGADFVKTSSGFGSGGATVEDVKLMKSVVGDKCQVKASTGVNNRKICDAFIEAGAVRMGTSKGIFIVNDVEPNL